MMAEGSVGMMMELETPMKDLSPEQVTPRRSERKRALFPSASPQTSDLGHMSPLGSSPDRFSSAPASPDSTYVSPIRKPTAQMSPFGRRATSSKSLFKESPRKQFSSLIGDALKGKITPISQQSTLKSMKKSPNEIVPADELEQTVLSVMDESDGGESPHSQRTPGTTPQNKELYRSFSDVVSSHPLTPSKRRCMPASGSGSITSVSPHSPERKRKHSLEARSRSAGAELPRARTSLFSASNRSCGSKRSRDDGIYLTGRNTKHRKLHGEINAGVRTGIRRPPKVKPKKQGKLKSVRDVASKSTKRESISPLQIPNMSLLAHPVKKPDEEMVSHSASVSLQIRSKRSNQRDEHKSESKEEEQVEMESLQPEPIKRIFKARSAKTRSATITLSKNIRIKVHQGRFIYDKSPPSPPAKRRRKLYSHKQQIEAIKAFDDNEEDVAASTRVDVQNILQKLEEDKCNSVDSLPSSNQSANPEVETSQPESSSLDPEAETSQPEASSLDPEAETSQPEASSLNPEAETSQLEASSLSPVLNSNEQDKTETLPSSPTRLRVLPSDGLLSPLSQLASSTSTLSINVGGDTLCLTEAQVQILSAIPDVIMEDDDLPLNEPLPKDDVSSALNEMKENETCVASDLESTPVKYFPIFTSAFSHQKATDSPSCVPKRKRALLRSIGNDQYQLDAGQKRFGATECGTCSAIYQMGEPDDELAHQEFHNAVKDLKFLGWKNERVIGLYGNDRVVVVRPGDPKAWWSKALDVLKVVDKDLGFAEGVHCDPAHSMVYLFISEKCVVGCILAIPVRNAHKMLEASVEAEGIDCCTSEEYPVRCGVSRIWVHRPHRRLNIARHLMDSMRKNFIFGHVLSVEEIAFSSPTVLGKIFAEHYTGRKDYFVYTQV